ncbi:hypothetical protein PHYBOEH_011228 [Phytophthora boehmeriae]|uniref:Uncharacterized protein n=1 Tax=Phytophthora boehmeriae TaxID=109152 RepID=A0A8T1VIB2_9STRA|nr:hypothetical protein PHYBOEH_011228 [Phytophthora boehmeriae]
MDVDVTEEDVAAAGQISQADIIERQAETITQLQRQVQRGTEYKQLTKTKLKEAAARLREYRLRVEALLKEVEEAREALKREKTLHTKTKKTATLNRRPKGRDVAVQTDVRRTIARQTQTQVDYVKTRRTISCGVQTETVAASRKRSRENDGQDGGDQLVPRLSRDSDAELLPVQSTAKGEMDVAPMEMWKPQALQMDGLTAMQFSQETSAALDAELASSDSEGGDDQMMIDMTTELVVTDKENGADLTELPLLDPDVSIAIDKELESSGEEEECRKAADENTGGVGKKRRLDEADNENKSGVEITGSQTALPLLDPGVSNDIDKELESSSEEGDDRSSTGGSAGAVSKERQVGKEDRAIKSEMNNSGLPLLDPGVSNEIDKELESSSEEEENAEHIGEGRGVMNIGRQQHQTTASTKTGVENNGNKVVLSALDPGVSNEIDKDLDSSGDEKQDGKAGESTDTVCKEVQQNREDGASEAGVDGADALQNKRVLVSIDDELDDEFATLDSDPEPEHQEEKKMGKSWYM